MMASVTDFDSGLEDINTIPFYMSEEDVYSDGSSAYPDVDDVSSGDAAYGQGAAGPYTAVPYAADQGISSDDAALLYEQLCNLNDNVVSLINVQKEGFAMIAVFTGLICGLLLILCLWLGGRK